MSADLICPDRLSAVIDLDAVVHNWQMLEKMASGTKAMPVLKADGYGHGMTAVAKALSRAGCEAVFTASLDEALSIKAKLPEMKIAYFDGPQDDDVDILLTHDIVPVLNCPEQLDVMMSAAQKADRKLPVILHLDTGMNRLGFSRAEAEALSLRDDLDHLDWQMVMSHLAMADDPEDEMNGHQKAAFDQFLENRPLALKDAKASLSATGGILLGPDYHYDVTRPGIGLYGMAPAPDLATHKIASLKPSMILKGRVLQIREAEAGGTVGYGMSHQLKNRCRLATLGGGYADGIMRQLSNCGYWQKDGHIAPIVGRVSMDVHVVDISDWPEDSLKVGDMISFIETGQDVHQIAKKSGTIAHDVLTRLGLRAKRHYAGEIVHELDL